MKQPGRSVGLLSFLVLASDVFAQPPPTPTPPIPGVDPSAPIDTTQQPPSEPVAPLAEQRPVTEPITTPVVIETRTKQSDKKSEPPTKVTAAPGKGLTIKVGDKFSTNLRSRINARYQYHAAPESSGSDEHKTDQIVNINTVRIWLSGHVYDPKLTYMIQLALGARDYRDGAISPIFDAFIDYKAHRDASVRVGQFFVPFDRLRTVREFALQLADRPRPISEFTLDRDVGAILYSDNFLGDNSPLAYRVGVFGGGGTNLNTTKEPGGLFLARVEVRPLGKIDDDSEGDLERRAKPAIAIGAGIATNRNTNRLRSTTGTTFTGGTTDYTHYALDLVAKWRGAAVQAEYLKKTSSRESIPSLADPEVLEWTRAGSGFVLQASYVFDPPIEIVGRFSRLYAPGGTDPKWIDEVRKLGQELAGGVNYYLNGHQFKFQADYIVRTTRDGTFDSGRADHVAHFQIDATF